MNKADKSKTPLGDQLRAVVAQAIDRGESQASIARASGVHVTTINRWMSGQLATITMRNADRIAAACLAMVRERD